MIEKEKHEWKQAFREEGEAVLGLFFPEVCPICGRPIEGGEGPSRRACPLCIMGLKRITGPTCLRCGRPVSSPGDIYCGECHKTGFDSHASFEQGICLYPYAEVTEKQRTAMHEAGIDFKYQSVYEITYKCIKSLLNLEDDNDI